MVIILFKFKKVVALVVGIFTIIGNASAFGGYTHYYIASKTIEKISEFHNLSDYEKLAYKSGCAVADIGWWNWDSIYPDSDGEIFKNKMIEIAAQSNDKRTKMFALGWSDHLIQDNNAGKAFRSVFKNAVGSLRYRINCGKFDSYFYKKPEYVWVNTLFIDYDLIRNVYFNINSPKSNERANYTNTQIHNEIYKIFCSFYLQSYLGMAGLSKEEVQKTETAIEEICSKCGKNNSDYRKLFA